MLKIPRKAIVVLR